MNTSPITAANESQARYELRFRSLSDEGRGYSFSCDAAGRVDLDVLSEKARTNYFFARALVGRNFARPAVRTQH